MQLVITHIVEGLPFIVAYHNINFKNLFINSVPLVESLISSLINKLVRLSAFSLASQIFLIFKEKFFHFFRVFKLCADNVPGAV